MKIIEILDFCNAVRQFVKDTQREAVSDYEVEALADSKGKRKPIILGITGDKPYSVKGTIHEGFDTHIHTHTCSSIPSPDDRKWIKRTHYRVGLIINVSNGDVILYYYKPLSTETN